MSAYVHTGEADTPKQDAKWAFLDAMEKRMPQLEAASPLALVMGDLNVGHREFDINVDGFAHMGMFPDFVAELRAVGLTDEDLDPLFNSAEAYISIHLR